MESTDLELLTRFATKQCESSFHQLVNRHLGMVFSVAMRVTGESGLAEEIAQSTFIKLSEKNTADVREMVVAGWLYHTSRNLALAAVRSEHRRRQREHIAVTMNTDEPNPSVVAEHLESAMDQLKPEDRDALVLRFFEDRNLRDVGRELGLSEDAARMRVNRSLEKLRNIFGKLGITGTTAWLTATLPASATASVIPAGLGASITATVLGGTAIATTAAIVTQTTSGTMNILNLKTAAAMIAAAALTGTSTYLVKERQVGQLRAEQAAMITDSTQLAAEHGQVMALVQSRDDQIQRLKKDVSDIPRLRGEVDRLNRDLVAMASIKDENQRLKDQLQKGMQATAVASRDTSVAPGELVTKDNLAFAGYATPEAALQSVTWALMHGTYDQANYGLSPELLAQELKDPAEREHFPSKQSQMAQLWESMRIAARKTLDPARVELKVKLKYSLPIADQNAGVTPPDFFVQPMVRVNGEWKFGGSTREHRPEWDDSGQIKKFSSEY